MLQCNWVTLPFENHNRDFIENLKEYWRSKIGDLNYIKFRIEIFTILLFNVTMIPNIFHDQSKLSRMSPNYVVFSVTYSSYLTSWPIEAHQIPAISHRLKHIRDRSELLNWMKIDWILVQLINLVWIHKHNTYSLLLERFFFKNT